jgi:cytochrome c oxidase subunit 2
MTMAPIVGVRTSPPSQWRLGGGTVLGLIWKPAAALAASIIAAAVAAPTIAFAQAVAVGEQSALRTGGPGAAEIGSLWNLMLVIGTAVTLLVVATLAYALFRRRRADELPPEADRPADWRGEHANVETSGRGREDKGRPESERVGVRWMMAGGVALPATVLTALLFPTLRSLNAVSPHRAARSPITIEVIGRQWWWEVRYLDRDPSRIAETANELHIPVGERVRVQLRAADVIHSFWVPGLQGKMDMIPGRTNVTWLQADRTGVWRGQCAEYCGLQHAKMALVVVAERPQEFARWLTRQREPAAEPRDSLGLAARETFVASGCVVCHAVRGTTAAGDAGPDLTHVATRLTLAAGELPNTIGHLAGWIANPQALKPGSQMPAVPLGARELHAIVHYLRSLR